METYKTVSQDIRDQLNAEAEAVQINLTGIYNDIYSTVDACPNACEMWKAIERMKQGESINVQDLETNLYWEFEKFTSQDGESLESYYSRFYEMINELIRNQCDVTNLQVNVQFLLQLQPEWQRAERIARTANSLALVAQQQPVYHLQSHPTQYTQNSSTRSQQAATRNKEKTIVNSPQPIYDQEPFMVAEDDKTSKDKDIDKLMALISLSSDGYENQRIGNVAGARETVETKKGEGYDLSQGKDAIVSNDDHYNVFAIESEHPEQSKSVHDTYPVEQDVHNVIINSLDMSYDREEIDQNDDNNDLDNEYSLKRKDFSKSKSDTQNNVSNDFSKPVTAHTLPLNNKSILKNMNVLAPEMYKLHTKPTQAKTSQFPQDSRKTNKHLSFSTGVIMTTSVSRLQLKSNPIGDRVMRNNSQRKKQDVEDHRRNVKLSKNKTSVTACNDNLNAKTLNVNFVSTTCGKCVLNDKHDMCVLNFVTKPLKKTVASKSNQKPRNITRKLYDRVSKACSWWYLKFTPPGYKWKPKSGKENLIEIVLFIVDSGNDQIALILGYGDLVQGSVTIKRVYYVKGLNHNLFSVGQFCDTDLEVAFQKSTCYIRDLKRNDLLTAWLWHRCLSHLNFDTINLLSKNDIVVGLPKLKFIKDHVCSSCDLRQAKRKSFHTKITPSSKRRLQLLHIDLCGPMRVASINGKRYVLVIVDDYSRYTWTHFLRSKDETHEVLIEFLRLVQRGLQAQVRIVQTDKGMEFLNQTLHAYFAAEGILHQMSVAQTPEQNGIVKNGNRTLVEAGRTMLSTAKVPLFFWAEAITTAYGENLDKMKEKGDACIFVGYSTQSRAYRVFNKRTRVIVEMIHVSFEELPQMASDHVNMIVTTSNDLDLLFSLMFDELLNGSTKVVSKSSAVSTADAPDERQQQNATPLNTLSTPDPTCQIPTQVPTVASTENMNQAEMIAENAQVENDEFINIFCTPIQDRGETSSRHVDSLNMHTFYQHHPSEHRWTKDHPLEQVIGNLSQSVRTRRQLESDGEMCMFALTVSRTEPKNIKEAMADSAWIESMQEQLH
nr:retrovirus-related Pol polyprotein from transposon TNT 1-94 [Tanacetum cinerariifolium]